jgi:hypothetical protein
VNGEYGGSVFEKVEVEVDCLRNRQIPLSRFLLGF